MPLGNSIGAFAVRNWFGDPPQRLQQSVEVLQYPGRDYQAVRRMGLRSQLFRVQSVVDVPTLVAGRIRYASYAGLVGTGIYRLVWNGWNLDAENQRVVVLETHLVELQRKLQICGALYPGNLYDLRVDWSLLMVPFFPG